MNLKDFFKRVLGANYLETDTEENVLVKVQTEFERLKNSEVTLKKSLDNATSEAKDYKNKYNQTLSEEERKSVERQAEYNKLIAERDSLLREKNIAKSYADYISLGYDEELAKSTAEAIVENNYSRVFENHKLFTEKQKELLERNNTKQTKTSQPSLQGEMTKEKFNNLSYDEMCDLARTQPEVFKKF